MGIASTLKKPANLLLPACRRFQKYWAAVVNTVIVPHALLYSAHLKSVKLRVWGESTSDKEIHDNHTYGGQKGAFCLSLWLNIVYFHIRGTLSAIT